MHMISKKDLKSAELETSTRSEMRNDCHNKLANGEVQSMKRPQFMSKNWTYLDCEVLEERQQFYC